MLQWGRRRSRRINFRSSAADGLRTTASMGPPTFSADQQHLYYFQPWLCFGFNGAAGDLGGSTSALEQSARNSMDVLQWGRRRSRRINCVRLSRTSYVMKLQWGRRRSRRINVAPPARSWTGYQRLQWGRRRSRRINVSSTVVSYPSEALQWGRRRSRRINRPSRDATWGGRLPLQWGRRRSRRINITTDGDVRWFLVEASMGPPTISADQRR